MRTLFEEGWLEFDHRVKYPHDLYNPKKLAYLEMLSLLASCADRLISFYKESDFLENPVETKEHVAASDSKVESIPEPMTHEDMKRIRY